MFLDWLTDVVRKGALCEEYSHKINSALSKKQLVDIGLDCNGVHWLCEMRQDGFVFNYNDFVSEFGHFINGNYIFTSKPNKNGISYTCELYCCCNNDKIDIRATATSFLACTTTINVGENSCASIHLDENCDVKINCPASSSCRVYIYGGANVEIISGDRIKLINVHKA